MCTPDDLKQKDARIMELKRELEVKIRNLRWRLKTGKASETDKRRLKILREESMMLCNGW